VKKYRADEEKGEGLRMEGGGREDNANSHVVVGSGIRMRHSSKDTRERKKHGRTIIFTRQRKKKRLEPENKGAEEKPDRYLSRMERGHLDAESVLWSKKKSNIE